MTRETHRLVRGYMASFSIRKRLEDGVARFDVELALTPDWQRGATETIVRFSDVRNVIYGNGRDGIDFGAHLCLSIDDISGDGWDGVGFKVHDVEGELSLYCRNFEIDRQLPPS